MSVLLETRDLSVSFATPRGCLEAVDAVNITLKQGQSLGLVGESGCGKSTLAAALLRLLPENGRIGAGEIRFDGIDILTLPLSQMRALRWQRIAVVFQNAMTTLNPVLRIGEQIVGALREHQQVSRAEAVERARTMFARVGLPRERLMQYPHEFSGGMKQRAAMALALICGPSLLLADEPTTALDVVAQGQVLRLLVRLKHDLGLSLIMISHDISAVAETCTHVAVMYAGQIVEQGPTRETLLHGRHPYTRALVASVPSLHAHRLTAIEGSPPDLVAPPPACRFAQRCPRAESICFAEAPPMLTLSGERAARCHFAGAVPAEQAS